MSRRSPFGRKTIGRSSPLSRPTPIRSMCRITILLLSMANGRTQIIRRTIFQTLTRVTSDPDSLPRESHSVPDMRSTAGCRGNYWGGGINWNRNAINVNRPVVNPLNGNIWQHNPAHRRGVRYNNVNVQQRFGNTNIVAGNRRRPDFRGSGGQQVLRPGGGVGNRPSVGTLPSNRPIAGARPSSGRPSAGTLPSNRPVANRPSSGANRSSSGNRPFSGANRPPARSRPSPQEIAS